MTNPIDLVQGTDEWRQARLGKVTASRIADLTAKTKTGYSASRKNYMAELVVERLTNKAKDGFVSKEMQWGTDNEPEARKLYAFMTDASVRQIGIVPHPKIVMAAASPDGLVGADGLVEFKCPNTWTHIETLLRNSIDGGYVKQVQWQMACTARLWCDFVSFDPRLPPDMQLFIQRVSRDDVMIAELENEVVAFLKEVDDTVFALRKKYSEAA